MRHVPPGSFGWLALNEVRLAVRARSSDGRRGLLARLGATQVIGWLLIAAWLAIGCLIGWAARDTAIPVLPELRIAALGVSGLMLSFMTAQAVLGSQRSLYDTGDLALLFSAPIPESSVLLAKMLGIAATIALTYAVLLLPIVVPVAVLGHPQLFGVVALLVALALTASAVGIALTLAVATLVGPRAARTFGQILAALLGGAVFLASQLYPRADHKGSAMVAHFERLRASGFGTHGLSALPGRAAFGDPLAIAILLGVALLLFAGAGLTLQRLFLSGYQDGGNRLSRSKPTGRASQRLFHAGLTRSIFAKEWRLLARDPALAFQIVMRLIYMAPLVLAMLGSRHAVPVPPALAFASVLIASQLVGSFAWLTVSAEDAPDLLAVAPVSKDQINRAKLLAAFAMAAPFALVLPIGLAWQTPLGALITVIMTALGGAGAGYAELKLGKPSQRSSFARRRQGGVIAGLASVAIAVVFGGGAAIAVYLVSGDLGALRMVVGQR